MKIATWSHSQINYGSQVKGNSHESKEKKTSLKMYKCPANNEHVSFELI